MNFRSIIYTKMKGIRRTRKVILCIFEGRGFILAKIFLLKVIFVEFAGSGPKIINFMFHKCGFFYAGVYCSRFLTTELDCFSYFSYF